MEHQLERVAGFVGEALSTNRRTDRRTYEQTDGRTSRPTEEQTDEQTNVPTEGRTDGRNDDEWVYLPH